MTDPYSRAKEFLVYAPVGLAYFLRDTTPTFMQMFIARGRSVVAQHEHAIDAEIARARSIGQLTVMFGLPEVEKRLNEVRAMGESLIGEQLSSFWSSPVAATAPQRRAERPSPTVSGARSATATMTPPASDTALLGIDAYDSLSASQVIERLGDLDADALGAVQRYELAHRNRKTILARIEQLHRPV